MAKGAYIGVNDIARKISKMYLGVDGVARKIKKAYLGDESGIARLFFKTELTKYGLATKPASYKYDFSATTVGDYAIFSRTDSCSVYDFYDKNLTYSANYANLGADSIGYHSAATTVGSHAIFTGGGPSSQATSVSADLVFTHLQKMVQAIQAHAAATAGNYAIFYGGQNGNRKESQYSNIYDGNLTFQSIYRSYGHYQHAATTVNNYAIFAGGSRSQAFAYDANLTEISLTDMSSTRNSLSATTVNGYGLFAGGGSSDTVEAYTETLTKISVTPLSVGRRELASTTVGDYALFFAGIGDGVTTDYYTDTVDAYDENLTRTTPTPISAKSNEGAATTVGDYAIYIGARGSDYLGNVAEVYTA